MNKASSFFNRIKKNKNDVTVPSCSAAPVKEVINHVEYNASIHEGTYRYAYSLQTLLDNPSAISNFIQFFEATGKVNLINFWIHVNGFKESICHDKIEMNGVLLSDSIRIYEKYIDENSRNTIGLPKRLTSSIRERILSEKVDSHIFDEAREFVFQLFKLRYYEEFKESIHYKKHELEVFRRNNVLLEDIIHCQSLLSILMEMIEEDIDRNRVQLLLAINIFESDSSEDDIEGDAMALYDRYISLQSSMNIGISDSTRTKIETLICSPDGKTPRNCFDPAKRLCLALLSDRYLRSIISSRSYHEYLEELEKWIDNTVDLPSLHRRQQRNGSNSVGSSSTTSTNGYPRLNLDELDKRLSGSSTPTLINSSCSTHRSTRLAEVDELGRYKSLYDNSLVLNGKDSAGKIKNKLRQYIDRNSLREEEIADEVARSIINDVIASTNSR